MRSFKDAIREALTRRRDVAIRFPVVCALALALAIIANLDIADLVPVSDRVPGQFYFGAVMAMLAALAVHLWGESRALPRPAGAAAAAAMAAIVGLCVWIADSVVALNALFVLAGLVLAVMSSAHLRRGVTASGYWLFNFRLGLAVLMGLAAIVVLCGGASLLVSSLELLFDIELSGDAHEHIWVTGFALVGPLFLLALIPDRFDEPFELSAAPGLVERAISALVNYALIPLILVYAVILHLYAVKIAVTGAVPKGEIGWLVLIFGGIGTASYLVAYPWREAGSLAVRWFLRSWFGLMVVPVGLLVMAVWLRVAQYGVTMERYGLMLFAFWMIALALYLAMARARADIRVIPASLAVLLLLAGFGPWGAVAVSTRSQTVELERLLEAEGVLVDGHMRADAENVTLPSETARRANSILSALDDLDALDRLGPWFAAIEPNPATAGRDGAARLYAIRTALGLDPAGPRPVPDSKAVWYRSRKPVTRALGGYGMVSGPHEIRWRNRLRKGEESMADAVDPYPAIDLSDSAIEVRPAEGLSFAFDLAQALRHLSAGDEETRAAGPGDGEPLVIEVENGSGRAALVITELGGRVSADDAVISNAVFWILWGTPGG